MKKKQQIWASVHWLGKIQNIGTEKECKAWVKENQIDPKNPIYFALPIKNSVRAEKCDKCNGEGTLTVLAD